MASSGEKKMDMVMNLGKCKPTVRVQVEGVSSGKGLKVCPGGKSTLLPQLTLKLAVVPVVVVKVWVLGKHGKPVLEVVLHLDMLKLRVKVVNGLYFLKLDLVVDVKRQKLLFLCLGKEVHAPVDLALFLDLFGLLDVDFGVKLP